MAPEYAMRGHLTEKADVYSFGVVAMEIVSGKSNANYTPDSECCVGLLDWVPLNQSHSPTKTQLSLNWVLIKVLDFQIPGICTTKERGFCRDS